MRMIIVEDGDCRCASCVLVGRAAERRLEDLPPEAKRDLASQLMTMANKDEGYDVA